MLALVAFILASIVSLFTSATLGGRLTLAIMSGTMTFLAALLLLARDRWRFTSTIRSVRRTLLARQNMSDTEYLERFADADPALAAQVRQEVAAFFNVPAQKIHPMDDLRKDLGFDALEPGFHSFVAGNVLAARKVEPQPFLFNTGGLTDIGDLVNEMQRILDRLKGDENENQSPGIPT